MKNPGESISIPEILGVEQAAAYIRAVSTALITNSAPISGVRCKEVSIATADTYNPNMSYSIIVSSTSALDGYPVQYRIISHQTDAFSEISLGQLVKGSAENDVEIRRWHTGPAKEPSYTIIRSAEEDEKIKWKRVATPEEYKDAEAMFATLATDFKSHLERKLAGHEDVRNAIDWCIEHPGQVPPKQKKPGLIGRLLLRGATRRR